MRTATKIRLGVAAALIVLGLAVFGGTMAVLKWDFTALSTVRYETKEHAVTEAYTGISILTDTADVVFVPSEGTETVVTCSDREKVFHEVSVKDGVLTVEIKDTREWYEYIEIFNLGEPRITVAIPEGEYGALKITASTGDVEIPRDFGFASMEITVSTGDVESRASCTGDVKIQASTGDISLAEASVGALELSASTGDMTLTGVDCAGDLKIGVSTGKSYLTDVTCQNLTSSGSTGDIILKNVIASGKFLIERSTGDVNLDGCDAAEIVIETSTGDVEGSLLTEKVFIPSTNTGDAETPDTKSGGVCRITTDTGDIKITIG